MKVSGNGEECDKYFGGTLLLSRFVHLLCGVLFTLITLLC